MLNMDVSRFLLSLILIFSSTIASAEIYKWVDQYGKTHFTDRPPAGQRSETVELKINTYSAVEITPLLERLGRKDKVVIYTTSWCGICNTAKKYFKAQGIPYIAYDVEKSRTGKSDFKKLKGRSVPVIILGGQRMNGFTVARFDALYRKVQQQKQAEGQVQVDVGDTSATGNMQ